MLNIKICQKCHKEYEGTVYQRHCDKCLIETLNKINDKKCEGCGDLLKDVHSATRYCKICKVLFPREKAKQKEREFHEAWKQLDNDEKARRIKIIADKLLHNEPPEWIKKRLKERKQHMIDKPMPPVRSFPRPCKRCGERFQPTSMGHWVCDKCNLTYIKLRQARGGYVTR